MIVYLVISLPKIPHIYTVFIGFWPTLHIQYTVLHKACRTRQALTRL